MPATLGAAGLLFFAATASGYFYQREAPPAIAPGGIVNAASRLAPSLPGGGIARGALFIIYGPRLGSSIPVSADPAHPPATLGGVIVTVSTAGASVNAPLLFVGPTQIAALMPREARAGEATITVSRNGQSSVPSRIRVLESGFGIFESGAVGEPAVSTRNTILSGAPLLPLKLASLKPGAMLQVIGTGLGNAVAAKQLRVFVGSKRAQKILDAGPVEGFKGLDRITIQLPADVEQGCSTPVIVETDQTASNASAINVSTGGNCVDSLPWLARTAERSRSGLILMVRTNLHLISAEDKEDLRFKWDYAYGTFNAVQPDPSAPPLPIPPAGTCTAYSGVFQLGGLLRSRNGPGALDDLMDTVAPVGPSQPFEPPPIRRLDAGAALLIRNTGDGAITVPGDPRRPGFYAAVTGGQSPGPLASPRPLFFGAGNYEVSGLGGADVSAFSATIPLRREIVWKNANSLNTVDRSKPVRLTWKPLDPDRIVLIAAFNTHRDTGAMGAAICVAEGPKGAFEIPPQALANIPASSSSEGLPTNLLVLASLPAHPISLQVRGLDSGLIADLSVAARTVLFR